ncbi:MAG: hypothetical protein HW394_1828, partial [Acidobacteria bacterium]|nr:hypothetical protein [Acidobacteriota bacterium]
MSRNRIVTALALLASFAFPVMATAQRGGGAAAPAG